jgi:arylsulfatase A-like enzyme
MNIVLLVIDSLRAQALRQGDAAGLHTPLFDRLSRQTLSFTRAYASECWTLPTHMSMFTGQLPSEHGAHFQTMAYENSAPTIAELAAGVGYHTELVTRNFVFDGTIPGVTRGFHVRTRPLAELRGWHPIALCLALAKPRVQRHVRSTGFFHPRHAEQRTFVRTFARSLLPADERALAHVLDVMARQRRERRPYFICCNLYDVHAPYAPQADSLLRSWASIRGMAENVAFPVYMSKLGQHAYLRDGFRISAWARRILHERYHRAIELMDAKLAAFLDAARSARLLDDTLLIVTSDHGEAFGEHGLYLHDASVYDTHLHVPLWIAHPHHAPAVVDDVVSTRDLFRVMLAGAGRWATSDTILDDRYRAARPIALAEHFAYPHRADVAPRHGQNLLAAVVGEEKYVVRREGIVRYDRRRDPDELEAEPVSIEQFVAACHRTGIRHTEVDATAARLRTWQEREGRGDALRRAA